MSLNIGCAKFVKDFRTGKFTTTWAYYAGTLVVSGKGEANGMPGESFFGNYVADITDSLGNSIHWEITIKKEGEKTALVEWYNTSQDIHCKGVGIIEGDTMTVGWQSV